MNGLSAGGVVVRFLAALVLVFGTYNPTNESYFHWVYLGLPAFDAIKAFAGVVLVIGWTVFLRAATRSLGAFGFILAGAFCGTLIWVGVDYGVIDENDPTLIHYICLVAIAGILTAGMVWSKVRRELSGQVDTDDVDGG